MWVMFLGWLAYAYFWRGDGFAAGLAMFGLAGGAVGFPFGQALQSWGARKAPFGPKAQSWIDWWKVMEFTFGAVAGLALSLGWTVLSSRYPAPAAELSLSWSPLSIAAALVWLALFVYVYVVLRPAKEPGVTWWFFALHLFWPLPGVLAGDLLWTILLGCSMVFWVVGCTVPMRWPQDGRERAVRSALWTLVGTAAGGALLLGLAGVWTARGLLGALLVYYCVLLGFSYRLDHLRRLSRGEGRALGPPIRVTHAIFTAQALLILWVLLRA